VRLVEKGLLRSAVRAAEENAQIGMAVIPADDGFSVSRCSGALPNVRVDAEVEAHAKIKKSSDGRSIQIPEKFEGRRRTVALLALSFSASVPGGLVVPHARKADA
jgi:hypothetical protein